MAERTPRTDTPRNRGENPGKQPMDQATPRGRGPARVSPLADESQAKVLVDAILDQPITTTARQICAVSKEVRSEFQEKFKPIAASRTADANWVFQSRNDSPPPFPEPGVYALGPGDDDLITLKVRCGGKVINAIVDTGSQLNVM
ncbi:hypothetical protein K523DRAFT_257279, partial [Schizophyllum commune Tattone D]